MYTPLLLSPFERLINLPRSSSGSAISSSSFYNSRQSFLVPHQLVLLPSRASPFVESARGALRHGALDLQNNHKTANKIQIGIITNTGTRILAWLFEGPARLDSLSCTAVTLTYTVGSTHIRFPVGLNAGRISVIIPRADMGVKILFDEIDLVSASSVVAILSMSSDHTATDDLTEGASV